MQDGAAEVDHCERSGQWQRRCRRVRTGLGHPVRQQVAGLHVVCIPVAEKSVVRCLVQALRIAQGHGQLPPETIGVVHQRIGVH